MPASARQKRSRPNKKNKAKKRRRKDGTAKSAAADTAASNRAAIDATNVAGLTEHDRAVVKKATASAKRAATKAKKKASSEKTNKTRCIQAEKKRASSQTLTKDQLMAGQLKRPTVADNAITVHPGDYVDVLHDLTPGTCDYGGAAWVEQTKVEGSDLKAWAHVRYVHGGKAWVPATRITRILPFKGAQGERACREKTRAVAKAAAAPPLQKPPAVVLPLLEALADGVRRRRPKGWRRVERIPRITDPKQRMTAAEKLICGAECRKLEAHLAQADAVAPQQWVRGERAGQFKKASKKNPVTKKNLADAWGVGRSTLDACAQARQ